MRNRIETTAALKWIFVGNIVVPLGNPFSGNLESTTTALLQDEEWIGHGYLKLLRNHILTVDHNGIIKLIGPESQQAISSLLLSSSSAEIVHLDKKHEFLCPGFIDLHVHSAQYAYAGTATDKPLFEWLDHYTFPAERRLNEDLEHARTVYRGVVDTTLAFGSTTVVYHTTLHTAPCKILVDCALTSGQRALIGKVCMDRNSPDSYRQTVEENLAETEELMDYIYQKCGRRVARRDDCEGKLPLVLPLVTPRFIPTCSPELMAKLGEIVKAHDCHFTTHISEGLEEVAYSKQCDKEDHGTERTGSEILESHGLLTDQCILAHCVHLTDSDCNLLKERGSAVAHCPLSNFFFGGGTFPCRKLLENGNLVGLGTDIAGGYSPSMLQTQRTAVISSRVVGHNNPKNSILDYRHAFYLATLGGAESLGLQHKIGSFRPGMEFDAIILSAKNSPVQIFETDSLLDVFQKLCVLGDDRNVNRIFVQGKEVRTK